MKDSKKSKYTRNKEAKLSAHQRALNALGMPPPIAPPPEPLFANGGGKAVEHFLYPTLPGTFQPWEVRKLPLEKLRARYIQAFSASMGNHSVAKFYCCWAEVQFQAARTQAFDAQIEETRVQLADRAKYIMYQGMGLVASEKPATPPQITAAMAKVVESLGSTATESKRAKKGYKLVVDGLARPPVSPPPGAS
jgi:hypothetical protein